MYPTPLATIIPLPVQIIEDTNFSLFKSHLFTLQNNTQRPKSRYKIKHPFWIATKEWTWIPCVSKIDS
jgi:hypothetical protein